ncbi:MAG: hypothetical protein WDO19_20920 [Bacteroidota bacterium]
MFTSKKECGGKKTGGRLFFFDDFSGNSLDRSKWNVRVTGGTVNNEQQAYVDSSITVSLTHGVDSEGAENGALVLQPRFSPGLRLKKARRLILFPAELIREIK